MPDDLFVALIIILVGTASFGLGKLSALEKDPGPVVVTESAASALPFAANLPAQNQTGTVFASKSGTKYYYPWCTGGNRITAANRVWFDTATSAKSAGLTLAANCPEIAQ